MRRYTFNHIPVERCYGKFKSYFDKLSFICKKYKIDPKRYIEFCVTKLNSNNWEENPEELLNSLSFSKYAEYLKIEEQYKNIYKYYIRSAENVVDECIRRDITPKEYIKEIITENKLGYEYISGHLSKYYIANIQNFDKIYDKLDDINKDELSILYDVSEKLNQDVQEAFLKIKNIKVRPISFTEELLKKKLNK